MPQELTQALVILLLTIGGGVILPHQAHSQEELREAAKAVVFSAESMDDIVSTYPFLQDDFQKTTEYKIKNSDQPVDVLTHMYIAESRDKETGVNILFVRFVGKKGGLWCGSNSCSVDIYVDEGTGYQKANSIITSDDISISRVGRQVALFFSPPQSPETQEWVLKDHKFVASSPHLE